MRSSYCFLLLALAAPFITACRPSDTACQVASVQKSIPVIAAGVPALGVKPLDPMTLAHINADKKGLKAEFSNTVVKGVKNCQVLSVSRVKYEQNIEMKCSVNLTGDYKMDGKLKGMSVNGKGPYTIKIRDIVVKVQYQISKKTVGNERQWSVHSWQHKAELKGGAEFQFQKLFNGNKLLSLAAHNYANTNWHEVFEEVSPPIVKAIVGNIVEDVTKFFHKAPIAELAVD